MDRVYGKEKMLQKVILCLTVISIFITMFGLIGMSLFKAGRKTKEIGIRKVNGASTREILLLLNKDFTKWALIAFLLAVPISYYALNRWLEGFAYKTQLQWWIFALAAMLILLIALLSVSFQSYRAAQTNPANTLKNE
jgi:putative ABC transport system permease protein